MNVEIDRIYGCRLWLGPIDKDGYGWQPRGKTKQAHRAVYEESHGPIAPGLVIDHLCRRLRCVALTHLEAVDQRENLLRKSWRYRARRERCARGHDLRSTAIVTPEGGRVCRECNRNCS